MASIRRQILEALKARVIQITKNNGYLTDAGKLVLLGEHPDITPEDLEVAIAFVIGSDDFDQELYIGDGGPADVLSIRLPVGIAAIARADLDNPLLALEDVLHDIKKAVEVDDRTLGGLVADILRGPTVAHDREEGSDIVGVSVTYYLLYSETWGSPDQG